MKANGARIRELRESKPLGLNEMAGMVGINSSNLSRLERGQKTARRETLERIATLLGAAFDEIAA
jgi:transcriptional regulator with XRE-family HTH domain